jgi:hypothetical protein
MTVLASGLTVADHVLLDRLVATRSGLPLLEAAAVSGWDAVAELCRTGYAVARTDSVGVVIYAA